MRRNNILFLVDDDVDDHEIFKSALQQVDRSTTLIIAGNGQEALQMLPALEQFPDYIFVDLNMPRMGGMQFLTELRKSDRLRHIPVIMYSTSNQTSDKNSALEAGAHQFITKPARYNDLCDLLDSLLNHRAQ
jgi:CheY-like chemotaxis protein